MKYMLDTNTCIYIIKEKPPEVFRRFRQYTPGDICISSITLAELEYGVAKSLHQSRNKITLACFLIPIEILPFSDLAAVFYGKIRANLEKQRCIIGAFDMLIAAHAIAEGLPLVTNNVSEFERIPGLKLENWVA